MVNHSSESTSILQTTQAPFLLTILLAAIAWLVSHSADRLFEQPTLEYKIEEVKPFDNKFYQCGVDNQTDSYYFRFTLISLAPNIRIQALTSYIRLPANSELKAGRILESPPSWAQTASPTCTENILTYDLEGIQPFTAHIAEFVTTSPELPIFHFESNNAVRAKKSGAETWIVRNEFRIYLCIFVVLSLIIVISIISSFRKS